MNYFKYLLALLIIIILKINVSAQNTSFKEEIKALKIGEQVPDIEFQLLNHTAKSAKLSDYKGKVVILDFWGITCTPCVAKFPYLDSLQKAHPDLVKLILVNRDNLSQSTDKLNTFFTKYLKKHPEFKLPTSFNDSISPQYFPHKSVPQCVWIDRDGKLVATTNGQEIDAEKIRKVYEGKHVDFRMKRDIMEFNIKQPLFKNGNGGEENHVKYKSIIAGYIDGLSHSQYSDVNEKGLGSRIFIRNVQLKRLFTEAYRVHPSVMVLYDIKHPDQYRIRHSDLNWGRDKTFCYELSTALTNTERLYKLMQHDLYAYFGMRAKLEMRKIKCYEIIKTGQIVKKKVPANAIPDEDDFRTIEVLTQNLNAWGEVPVFDTRVIKDEQLIAIKEKDILDPTLLKKALNENGYDIIETEKELEMFVISEVEE
jgi:thiol-disulfide isomerase/thioredoxin